MKSKSLILIFTSILAFFASPVMAYIDPGSGSAIMSAVIGFFVAIAIAVKGYWYKLKSLFVRSKNKEDKQSS